jgi:hypothetical protein
MDIDKFIERFPYLYHLTSKQNAENIIEKKILYSANSLIDMSKKSVDAEVKTHKRLTHYILNVNGTQISLRDQRPISEVALPKCLTDGWSVGDFLYHLNDRVFMWPTLERLGRHFKRYEKEKPIIFRFSTEEMLQSNPHVKFCRLNSGATRPNSHLEGIAPERGPNTFLSAKDYTLPARSVAEVTFEKKCKIVGQFGIGNHQNGLYKAK